MRWRGFSTVRAAATRIGAAGATAVDRLMDEALSGLAAWSKDGVVRDGRRAAHDAAG